MRIPFLNKRKRTPTLYQKGIENEFSLNKRAQHYIVRLFSGEKEPAGMLDFVFEQIFIIYQLSLFSGSHKVSEEARKALCMLRETYEEMCLDNTGMWGVKTLVTCSLVLKMGESILQELPRNEFKLAYVQAKKITETRDGITNYLKVFYD